MRTMSTPPATAGVTRFGDSWRNWTRITTVRIVVQTVTLALFLAWVLLATFANLERFPTLRTWVSKYLEVDPLVALATALATHTVYRGLLWSLIILIPTLFLGRFFCGWICPLGTLNHFIGWLFAKRGPADAYHPRQRLKYVLLIALLVTAALGSVQVGLLDPLCLLHRSVSTAALPALERPAQDLLGPPRLHQCAWLIGSLLFALLAANAVSPRFFCRVLCPLGALLGVLSRWGWWRIERDPDRCRGCQQCRVHCEGACNPDGDLRRAECLVCFNCIEQCPESALRFSHFPPREHEVRGPNVSRRQLLFAGLSGLVFYPLARGTGRSTRDFSSRVIRPPGAVEELEFLERCLKCDQCARVCPTNVIQPAGLEAGIEGLWTPVLNFRLGHCQLHCTACGQVCPTGALRRVSENEKLGTGSFSDQGPIRLGTAHIDVGRCLPHSAGVACSVCEEVCPTSPKAIYTERIIQQRRDGQQIEVSVPRVDIDRCIGCGICEYECPVVGDRRAIYITAEGESRSRHCADSTRSRTVRLPHGQ